MVDLGSKGMDTLAKVEPGGRWQKGPVTASFGMDQWPATQDIKGSWPAAETRVKEQTLVPFPSMPCLEEEEEEVKEVPGAGNGRSEGRAAVSGPNTKVREVIIY